jgi:hypothetical protein
MAAPAESVSKTASQSRSTSMARAASAVHSLRTAVRTPTSASRSAGTCAPTTSRWRAANVSVVCPSSAASTDSMRLVRYRGSQWVVVKTIACAGSVDELAVATNPHDGARCFGISSNGTQPSHCAPGSSASRTKSPSRRRRGVRP